MPNQHRKHLVLTDVANDTHLESLTLDPAAVGGSASGYRLSSRILRGGLSEGVQLITVDNGRFSFDVLPTRGMSLWKGRLGDLDIGWRSPVRGPVHPSLVPLWEPSGLGWLDGFDELLVRCGLESNGAPDFTTDGRLLYPLHGRIGNRPAQRVQVAIDGDTGEIALSGVVEETRFHFSKLRLTTTISTRVGEPGFRLHDRVENLSATPATMQLLYHINLGPPFLEAGARFVAPVKTVVPRTPRAAEDIASWDSFLGPTPGYTEQVYFLALHGDQDDRTQVLLKNANGDRGISLHFDGGRLPCFTLWKNTTAVEDGYVTGLEPGVNFPNPRSFESQQGRVLPLAPGAGVDFEIQFTVHHTAQQLEQAEADIATLSQDTPQIHPWMLEDWCAP